MKFHAIIINNLNVKEIVITVHYEEFEQSFNFYSLNTNQIGNDIEHKA